MTPAHRVALTSLGLVLANLVPIYGVFAHDWQAFDVVALYWFENVVVGAFNVVKMLLCNPDPAELARQAKERAQRTARQDPLPTGESPPAPALPTKASWAQHIGKIFFVPFFAVHYGMFTFVHGLFVVGLLAGHRASSFSLPISHLQGGAALVAIVCIVASHGLSLVANFLLGGEYRRTTLERQMFAPYGRIVVLHVAVLGGAFAILLLGSPMLLLLLLIAGKIALDMVMHWRSHGIDDGAAFLREVLARPRPE